MYHDVVKPDREAESGFNIMGADRYKITEARFREQIELISRLVRYGHDMPVFTFDDGGSCSAQITAPILEEFGLIGIFFIPTAFIGQPGFVTEDDIRLLEEKGHIIGSHSHTHPAMLSYRPSRRIGEEWRISREILEKITGKPILHASVPGGWYSGRVCRLAKAAGFTALYTSRPALSQNKINAAGILLSSRFAIDNEMDISLIESLTWKNEITLRALFRKWLLLEFAKKLAAMPYMWLRGLFLK